MLSPLNFIKEQNLLTGGFKSIAGIDEAGRGSWAGPVVAGCLRFDFDKAINGETLGIIIADSKLLSPSQREKAFSWLIDNFDYGVGIVDNNFIDTKGIIAATKLAMKRAAEKLSAAADYLLIDAVKLSDQLPINQESIIKGDRLIWSIAAASIIAKVSRDRIMDGYKEDFPDYGFDRHKGYGTKLHQEMICRHGVSSIHRRSYRPVAELLTD